MQTTTEGNRGMKILARVVAVFVVVCFTITFPWSKISPIPLLLGLSAFAIAVTVPVLLARRRRSLMVAWLAVYTVAYFVLSWRGGYIDANLGGSDNRSIWYPAFCGEVYWSPAGRQKSTLRPLGWFFSPLVMLDRTLVHRTRFDAF
jgi:hypothetical protein